MGEYDYSGACGGAWLQECRRDGKGWHRKIKQQNGVKKISTVIYYYSATGNSLYVARELQKAVNDVEIRSIVEAMQEDKPQVNAECVGFVFPMHYFSLPLQVEEFLQKLTILESPYIFAIATCGVPYWGRPFVDAEKILKEKNRQIHAAWYVRLVSNYIPLRDIAADWRINMFFVSTTGRESIRKRRIRMWKLIHLAFIAKIRQPHGNTVPICDVILTKAFD